MIYSELSSLELRCFVPETIALFPIAVVRNLEGIFDLRDDIS